MSGKARVLPPLRWSVPLLVLSAIFMGFDIASHPIVLWDESRVASNAIEMSRTGFSLITTYGFKPDLWNTKPPLLVWLIAGSIDLFGPSEWAVRLPTLFAALATVAIVMGFTWRLTRSLLTTVVATLLLVLSPGYYGSHVVQSGDYDALLTLFTTAYLFLIFHLIHQRRPQAPGVLLMALMVSGACLTKGVAGLIPGVGAAVYVIVAKRLPRLFRSPWYLAGAALVVALVGGFYMAREHALPGYLKAMAASELGGRYLHGMPGHVMPIYYYPQMFFMVFSLGPALLVALAAPFLRWPALKSTAFLSFGGFVAVADMVVLSLSQTKIYWYLAPLYPVVSILLAIVLVRVLKMLPWRKRQQIQIAHLVAAVLAIYVLVNTSLDRFVYMPHRQNIPQGRYGLVFAQLAKMGVTRVRTYDSGVANDDSLYRYTPQLHFYRLAWETKGLMATPGDPNGVMAKGEVAVTCDERHLDFIGGLGAVIPTVDGCEAARAE